VNPPADPLDPVRADANRARAYPHADRDDPAVRPLDPISPVSRDVLAGSSDSTYRATGGDPMTRGMVRQDTNETPRRSASCAAASLDEPLAGGAAAPNPAQSGRAADPLAGNDSGLSFGGCERAADRRCVDARLAAVDPLDPLDETETSARVVPQAPRAHRCRAR